MEIIGKSDTRNIFFHYIIMVKKKKDYVIKSTRKSFRVSKLKDKHIIYYGKRAEDDCPND